jgi:hypothetical protein
MGTKHDSNLAGVVLCPASFPQKESPQRMPNSPSQAERSAVLENETQNIGQTLGEIKQKLDSSASPVRSASWFHVGPVLAFLFTLIAGGFFYLDQSVIPRATTAQGNMFNERFGASDQKIQGVDSKVTSLDQRVSSINDKLELVLSIVRPTVNRRTMTSALKHEASVNNASLREALPNTKNILTVVKNMRVPLRSQDYRDVSQRFFSHYVSAKEPLKNEVWKTLLDLASVRTATDAKAYPVTQSEIEKAKVSKNYFEGEIDLSSRTTWRNAIFKNCKIKISKPDSDLGLVKVRFIDCRFEEIAENERNRKIVTSFLQSSGPEVTVAVPNFRVLKPYFRIGSPVEPAGPS